MYRRFLAGEEDAYESTQSASLHKCKQKKKQPKR